MSVVEDLKSPAIFVTPVSKPKAQRFTITPAKMKRYFMQVGPQTGKPVFGNNSAGKQLENTNKGWDCDENLMDEYVGRTGLHVIAAITDVVRGKMYPKGNPATLIVMKFKFQPHKGKHFKSADITVSFPDSGDSLTPVVRAIAPDGVYGLGNSDEPVSVTIKGGVEGVTADGVTLNGGLSYLRTEKEEKTDNVTVTGTPTIDNSRRSQQHHGNNNAVVWGLEQNHTTRHGIPTWLQGAILLRHGKNPPPFKVLVNIKVVVDRVLCPRSITFKTLTQVLDPDEDQSVGKDWNVDNLGGENLEALQKIIMLKPVSELDSPATKIKLLVNRSAMTIK